MGERIKAALPALVGLGLFAAALAVLHREVQSLSWDAITTDVWSTPPALLAVALTLTAANYAVLTGYDFIALASIERALPRWRVFLASFVAYAVANNVGFAALSGASVRYRFYTRWGITAEELSRIVFSYSVTFWLGLFALGGLALASSPLPQLDLSPLVRLAAPVGWALVAAALGYVALTAARRTTLRLGRFSLPLPGPGIASAQLLVSSADWALAGAVFYALLPASGAGFFTVLGAFLAAQLLGLASHVPGGVGVFETLMVLLLSPYYDSGQLLPSLVVYRVVYYLVPLVVALAILLADEVRQRREATARVGAALGRASEWLTPRVLAVLTFGAGLVLLVSGATPAAEGRLAVLGAVLPLGIIETSHFVGSLAGTLLLLLSQGLARRLDAAWFLTVGVLVAGITASLLKAADYEEAVLLALLLGALLRARPVFDRRAALWATRFSPAWIAAVAAALLASTWLGVFAFKHVEYSNDLWWRFELEAEASRYLRASVGAATLALMVAASRLLRQAPHEIDPPSPADVADADRIIAAQPYTAPNLVHLRDKGLLFDETRQGFVMYGVQGHTWVALGDPVGPPELVPRLIRAFLERCDDFGGTPVFYEVGTEHLHHYADMGLTFVKLGEAARVDLASFTTEGGAGAKWRQALRRTEKEGATFRIVPAQDVPPLLDELETVSDDWLDHKAGSEKGFSLGFFDREYLSRFPLGVIEKDGRILAFANVWPSALRDELSVDLMRYRRDAFKGVMESVFVHLMAWGKQEGYRWFALGMAPMSGFEASPVAPLWYRVGALLFSHGERLYNFQGLRAFKEKFHPVWEPHYLAYPGGLKLPLILADVSALISGGYRRMLRRG